MNLTVPGASTVLPTIFRSDSYRRSPSQFRAIRSAEIRTLTWKMR